MNNKCLCSLCKNNDCPKLPSWFEVVLFTLKTLSCITNEKKGWFNFESDIIPFISNHWKQLLMKNDFMGKTENWKGEVKKQLRAKKDINFIDRFEDDWALTDSKEKKPTPVLEANASSSSSSSSSPQSKRDAAFLHPKLKAKTLQREGKSIYTDVESHGSISQTVLNGHPPNFKHGHESSTKDSQETKNDSRKNNKEEQERPVVTKKKRGKKKKTKEEIDSLRLARILQRQEADLARQDGSSRITRKRAAEEVLPLPASNLTKRRKLRKDADFSPSPSSGVTPAPSKPPLLKRKMKVQSESELELESEMSDSSYTSSSSFSSAKSEASRESSVSPPRSSSLRSKRRRAYSPSLSPSPMSHSSRESSISPPRRSKSKVESSRSPSNSPPPSKSKSSKNNRESSKSPPPSKYKSSKNNKESSESPPPSRSKHSRKNSESPPPSKYKSSKSNRESSESPLPRSKHSRKNSESPPPSKSKSSKSIRENSESPPPSKYKTSRKLRESSESPPPPKSKSFKNRTNSDSSSKLSKHSRRSSVSPPPYKSKLKSDSKKLSSRESSESPPPRRSKSKVESSHSLSNSPPPSKLSKHTRKNSKSPPPLKSKNSTKHSQPPLPKPKSAKLNSNSPSKQSLYSRKLSESPYSLKSKVKSESSSPLSKEIKILQKHSSSPLATKQKNSIQSPPKLKSEAKSTKNQSPSSNKSFAKSSSNDDFLLDLNAENGEFEKKVSKRGRKRKNLSSPPPRRIVAYRKIDIKSDDENLIDLSVTPKKRGRKGSTGTKKLHLEAQEFLIRQSKLPTRRRGTFASLFAGVMSAEEEEKKAIEQSRLLALEEAEKKRIEALLITEHSQSPKTNENQDKNKAEVDIKMLKLEIGTKKSKMFADPQLLPDRTLLIFRNSYFQRQLKVYAKQKARKIFLEGGLDQSLLSP